MTQKISIQHNRLKDLVEARTSEFEKVNEQLRTEITERKRVEEALRESENRYRDLVEYGEYLICTHDLEGWILSTNKWPTKILGYDQNDLLRMNIKDLLAPEAKNKYEDYIRTVCKQGYAKGLLLIQTRSGEKRIWEYNNTLRTEGVPEPMIRGMAHDITELKQTEREREQLILQLQDALAKVKQLSGFLPICASCKKIRDDKGYWNQIESYIRDHSEAEFSHGICPDCMRKLYPDMNI